MQTSNIVHDPIPRKDVEYYRERVSKVWDYQPRDYLCKKLELFKDSTSIVILIDKLSFSRLMH